MGLEDKSLHSLFSTAFMEIITENLFYSYATLKLSSSMTNNPQCSLKSLTCGTHRTEHCSRKVQVKM